MMELKEAIHIVIEHLDEIMNDTPSREAADACNYLSEIEEKL